MSEDRLTRIIIAARVRINLKGIREDIGFSQEKLADVIGVARSSIAKWENNYTEIPDHCVQAICEFMVPVRCPRALVGWGWR